MPKLSDITGVPLLSSCLLEDSSLAQSLNQDLKSTSHLPHFRQACFYSKANFLFQFQDTVYVQLPRGQKRPADATSTSTDQEGDPPDASAAAFGRSVGAQLHHLSKMQRCIAEKLISDIIYHGKMEQLSLDTSINVKAAVGEQIVAVIPQAGPSWYDTDLDNGGPESSSSCPLTTETSEDLVRREIEETQSAVNFIKMERDDAENYIFHVDEEV